MKRRRSKYSERRISWQLLLAMAAPFLLMWAAGIKPRTVSPSRMVRDQIVRGDRVESGKPRLVESNAVFAAKSSISTVKISPEANPARGPAEMVSVSGKKYLRVSFARLSSFEFKVTDPIADANGDLSAASEMVSAQVPDTVKFLNEKQVAVTGFVMPVKISDGLATEVLLLKSQSACCYGIMPSVNEWIIVHIAGKGIKPVMDIPMLAMGTLHVGDVRENGHLTGIYQLDLDHLTKAND